MKHKPVASPMLLILTIEQTKLKRVRKMIVLIQDKLNQPATEILLIIKGMKFKKIIIRLMQQKNRMDLKIKSSKIKKPISTNYLLRTKGKDH